MNESVSTGHSNSDVKPQLVVTSELFGIEFWKGIPTWPVEGPRCHRCSPIEPHPLEEEGLSLLSRVLVRFQTGC